MTRDKWRELCKATPKRKSGKPRFFHISTFGFMVPVNNKLQWIYARNGNTYRNGMEPVREI